MCSEKLVHRQNVKNAMAWLLKHPRDAQPVVSGKAAEPALAPVPAGKVSPFKPGQLPGVKLMNKLLGQSRVNNHGWTRGKCRAVGHNHRNCSKDWLCSSKRKEEKWVWSSAELFSNS